MFRLMYVSLAFKSGSALIKGNNKIKIKKGDSIYFFSDGFADQIGGPDNRKFMSERIRNIIMEYKDLPMTEIGENIENKFMEWMGSNKQIDDVLMIGIRF